MIATCWRCGRTTTCQKHHAILGRGKRKQHETSESTFELCPDCHRFAHGKDGHAFLDEMRKHTQWLYFSQGYSEEQTRHMMGGKLMLDDNNEIYKGEQA